MTTMRTGLAVLVLLVVAGLAACGASENESAGQATRSDKPVEIAFFAPTGNSWVEASLEAAREVARNENSEITVFDSGFDPQKQARQIQDAAASGRFDAFLVNAIDNTALVPAVEDAIARAIKVVAMSTAVGPDISTNKIQVEGVSGSVFSPVGERAPATVQLIASACGDRDPCKVALMVGVLSTGQERYMRQAVKEGLRRHANIELVAEREGGFLPDPAYKAAQDILQAHPDVDVIATTADQMALGVERAVDDADLTGKVKILGNGGGEIGVRAVREGRWYGDVHPGLPKDIGKIATEIAIRAARGQEITRPVVDPNDSASVPYIITGENKSEWADFTPQWQG